MLVSETYLRIRFEVRWKKIEIKTQRIKRLRLPNKDLLWQKVLESYRNGFKCEYCGQTMLIKDPVYPYKRSFSLDHKTSIWLGGTNAIENFAVVCHRCNIVKGTMTSETFKALIFAVRKVFSSDYLLDKIFDEMLAGRMADKLEREENFNSLENALWTVSYRFAKEGWLPIICPKCLENDKIGIISNKMASDRLICLRCGKEFSTEET